MPEITLPEVKLPELKWPEALRDMNREDIVNAARDVRMPKMSDLPDIDLSKIELPKQIADHLPNRKRSNPIFPIAGFLAIGAAIAAAWWLMTSPVTGLRIREAVNDLKARMNGEPKDQIGYDEEEDLGSLLSDPLNGSSADMSDVVPVGPGEMSEATLSR